MQTQSKSQKIAVTGAAGRVGSHLVEILEQRGHDVVPIARSKGVDVVSGEGLDEALAGAETIIDAATGPSPDQERGDGVLHRFGTEPAASRRRGRGGADRRRLDHRHRQVPGRVQRGEGGAGADAARRPAPSPDRSRSPVPRVRRSAGRVDDPGWRRHLPEMRTQLVAARVVAEALADAAEEPEIQNGRITEIAGPQEERLAVAAAALLPAGVTRSRSARAASPATRTPRPMRRAPRCPTRARSSPAPASKSGSRRPRPVPPPAGLDPARVGTRRTEARWVTWQAGVFPFGTACGHLDEALRVGVQAGTLRVWPIGSNALR